MSAQQPQLTLSPGVEPTLLLEGPFAGVPPKPEFWKAMLEAKKKLGPVLKEKVLPGNAGKKAGRKFSSYNDWIDHCEPILQGESLILQQSSSIEPLAATPGLPIQHKATIKFVLIEVTTGTGMVYRMDWPLWGFQGPAPDDQGAALGYAIKYGLRGIFLLSQADSADEAQQAMQERVAAANAAGTQRVFGAQNQQQQPYQPPQQQPYQPPQQQPYQPPQQQQPYQPPQQQPYQPPQQQPPQQSGYGYGGGQQPHYGGYPQQGTVTLPPQQSYAPPQQQLPPITHEPVVSQAHAQLGPGSPLPGPGEGHQQQRRANPNPPQQEVAPKDPVFEDLMAVGWNEELARQIAAVPANDTISSDLADQWFNAAVTTYFNGDVERATSYWFKNEQGPDTGFIPQPGSGKLPNGAQLRRFCVKLDWNSWKKPA